MSSVHVLFSRSLALLVLNRPRGRATRRWLPPPSSFSPTHPTSCWATLPRSPGTADPRTGRPEAQRNTRKKKRERVRSEQKGCESRGAERHRDDRPPARPAAVPLPLHSPRWAHRRGQQLGSLNNHTYTRSTTGCSAQQLSRQSCGMGPCSARRRRHAGLSAVARPLL